ncbi:MAG: GNAT family N-acetyltransferase [Acidobacteriota bacterium]|nr:GNAT family N-acetyltransferase [Acidobacteriota bacterium]
MQEVHAISQADWQEARLAYPSRTLHNDPLFTQALTDVYGHRSVFLALKRGSRIAGLVHLLLAGRGVTVACSPLPRVWARPAWMLDPEERAADWVGPVAVAAREIGADILSYYTYDDRDAGFKRLHTVEVTIDAEPEALAARIHPRQRRHLKRAEKAGVTVREMRGAEVSTLFCEMYESTWQRGGRARLLRTHHRASYFARLLTLPSTVVLVASVGTSAVAATIVTGDQRAVYYQHNASFPSARSCSANHRLFWEVIVYAHRTGRQAFDVGGVPAEPPPEHFKLGWGHTKHVSFSWHLYPLTAGGRICAGAASWLRPFLVPQS